MDSLSLEEQLQPELNNPRPAVGKPRISQRRVRRLGDRAEGRGTGEVRGRQTQVGVIEKVEELRAELRCETIAEFRHLANGEIENVQSWPEDRVARRAAESS